MRQEITISPTVDAIVHTLYNFSTAAKIFFGHDSLLTAGLLSWCEAITFNLTCYEIQAAVDPSFIAKVITAIDTLVNFWLTECSMEALRSHLHLHLCPPVLRPIIHPKHTQN